MKVERAGKSRGLLLTGPRLLWGLAAFVFYIANGLILVPRVGWGLWGASVVLSLIAGACGQMSNERMPK